MGGCLLCQGNFIATGQPAVSADFSEVRCQETAGVRNKDERRLYIQESSVRQSTPGRFCFHVFRWDAAGSLLRYFRANGEAVGGAIFSHVPTSSMLAAFFRLTQFLINSAGEQKTAVQTISDENIELLTIRTHTVKYSIFGQCSSDGLRHKCIPPWRPT